MAMLVHNGNDLQPCGERAPEAGRWVPIWVYTTMRAQNPIKGQGMTVKGRPAGPGDHVVGNPCGKRR